MCLNRGSSMSHTRSPEILQLTKHNRLLRVVSGIPRCYVLTLSFWNTLNMVKVEGDIVDTHFNFSCCHAEKSSRMFSIGILMILVIATISVESVNFLTKCCDIDYIFNDNYNCVYRENENQTIFHALKVTDIGNTSYNVCVANSTGEKRTQDGTINITWTVNTCLDILANGTVVSRNCLRTMHKGMDQCDSIFTPLKFWGASIVVFANIIYVFPYLIVVIFYFAISDLRHRAYDKAVLCYNGSQLFIALILLGMGLVILCHKSINSTLLVLFGLSLMFLTISSVFWLFFICFDMTLVITRFRWMPSADPQGREEARKFRIYSAFAWGGAFVPTAFACFMELLPIIPKHSPLRPNFERFDDGANLTVIIYVTTLPVIMCVMNNVLFVYTTYKIIRIRKSTAVANENVSRNAKKKYFVFLRLYLLMDAPWIIGALAAIYTDLWVLKFCRMIQPILMLFAILPKKVLINAFRCSKQKRNIKNGSRTIKNGVVTYC